jgi:hypothetical protein
VVGEVVVAHAAHVVKNREATKAVRCLIAVSFAARGTVSHSS